MKLTGMVVLWLAMSLCGFGQTPFIALTAKDAAITGGAQYVADGNFVGFWMNPDIRLHWDITVDKTGTGSVELVYAVEPGCGGDFALEVAGQRLTGKTESTGSWLDFKTMTLGTITLAQGDHTVTLSAGPFAKAPMNVREIRLNGFQGTAQMVLTNAAQIRDLSKEKAAKALPVRLRGVTVWGQWGQLVLVDETSGIYCDGGALRSFGAELGNEVEVDGVTDAGNFAPCVRAQVVRKVGEGKIPEPKRVTYEDLRDGSWDGQWVEITGTVRESEPWSQSPSSDPLWEITFFTGGSRMPILITKEQAERAKVGAKIRLRCVCFYQYNEFRQVVRPVLAFNQSEGITILNPAPEDLWDQPAHPIGTLLEFNPKGLQGRCLRVQGVVTHVEPGAGFWITDGNQGAHVLTKQPGALRPGDYADVVGFLDCEEGFPVLQDARFRVAGQSPVPAPLRLETPRQALQHNGALVELDATIRSQVSTLEGCQLELEAGPDHFTAFWPDHGEISPPAAWQPGAKIRVAGICIVALEAPNLLPGTLQQLKSLRLILRSPADIQILQPAPWWTPEHTSWVLAASLTGTIILGGAIFWSYRRRSARRLAEVRAREALAEERARIARDLHDDLGANLAEIAMVSELARQSLPARDPARNQFDEIFTRAEANTRRLGEIVWSVNPANDTLENFASYVAKFAQDHLALAGVECRLNLPETLPPCALTSVQRHHLLLAIKEAIHNAIQHGRPKTVTLQMVLQENQLHIIIEDDGRGFDEATVGNSPRGSANMRRRIEAIGGTFTRQSARGLGTTVTLSIPLKL